MTSKGEGSWKSYIDKSAFSIWYSESSSKLEQALKVTKEIKQITQTQAFQTNIKCGILVVNQLKDMPLTID